MYLDIVECPTYLFLLPVARIKGGKMALGIKDGKLLVYQNKLQSECGCCIPPPTGSGICCNPFLVNSGSCVVASVEECRNIGGFFVTGVSSCLPGICSPPTGACHFCSGTTYATPPIGSGTYIPITLPDIYTTISNWQGGGIEDALGNPLNLNGTYLCLNNTMNQYEICRYYNGTGVDCTPSNVSCKSYSYPSKRDGFPYDSVAAEQSGCYTHIPGPFYLSINISGGITIAIGGYKAPPLYNRFPDLTLPPPYRCFETVVYRIARGYGPGTEAHVSSFPSGEWADFLCGKNISFEGTASGSFDGVQQQWCFDPDPFKDTYLDPDNNYECTALPRRDYSFNWRVHS